MTSIMVHKTIHKAIAAAIGEVKKLGKSDRNKFDGYNFVSIDKFLEMVNPICANNGLFPSISTESVDLYENTNSKGGKSTWGRFNFEISLYHESGEQFGPFKSMASVPMNGAQASGSAQSYALKQFFRGLFMIPTGDKDDPDFAATEQHHSTSVSPEQFVALRDQAEAVGANIPAMLKAFGATSLEEFPVSKLQQAMAALQKKAEAA